MTDFADRRRTLVDHLSEDAFVALNIEGSDPASLRYLTGFTGEGALILTASDTLLLTDSRYTAQAQQETRGLPIQEGRGWAKTGLAEALRAKGIERVSCSSDRVSHHWVETTRNLGGFTLLPIQDPVAELRRTKSSDEIAKLKRAAEISDAALTRLVEEIRIGMTEAEVALRLEWLIRTTDAEGVAFEFNASAGPNSALNHYRPSLGNRTLQDGDLLLFDFGACVDGYRSDLTRTFSVGAATDRSKEIYDVVLRANLAAIDAVHAGMTGVEADAVAREVIAAAGYADHFGHGLGHGIGLEVHESPSLSTQSKDILVTGMVVTIEPGVYIPGVGGVRIEDDVVITEGGCKVITAFPKDLLLEVG